MNPGVLALNGPSVITGRGYICDAPSVREGAMGRLLAKLGDNGEVLIGGPDWDWIIEPPQDWKVTGGPAWYTARHGDQKLRFGKLAEMSTENDPMIGEDLVTTAVRHQLFADLVGVPFYADGGSTSGLLMDHTISVRGRPPLRVWDNPRAPQVPEPFWCGPWEVRRGEYHVSVTVDKNAQFLCAANSAFLPLDALEHTGPISWDVHRAGLWLIVTPENPYEGVLPHPCGAMSKPGAQRWVASPTVELLDFLGLPVKVVDSWTCDKDRSRRVLRGWYEALRDARAALHGHSDHDSLAILQAVKDTYARGISHLDKSTTRRWYRPDWKAILNARSRCGVWRAMWQAGTVDSIWPVSTHTDSVSYDTQEAPASYRMGPGMGEWKVIS